MTDFAFKQFSDLNNKKDGEKVIRSAFFDEYVGIPVEVTGTIDNPRIVDDVLYVYLVNDLGCIRVCVPPHLENKLQTITDAKNSVKRPRTVNIL